MNVHDDYFVLNVYFDNILTEKCYVNVSELIDDMCLYYGDGITEGIINPKDIYQFVRDEYSLDDFFSLDSITQHVPIEGEPAGVINIKLNYEGV